MADLRFRAMGTEVVILVPEGWQDAALQVQSLFEQWDERLSRFREDSELGHVNQHAGETVRVSELFARVLDASLAAARATDGVFDPTLHDQLVSAGYDRTFDEVPAALPIAAGSSHPGGAWREIELDRTARTVRLPAGAALDFGGIAKGMAVDEAVDALAGSGIDRAAVDAGGDLQVLGLPPSESSWQIAVDLRAGQQTISLKSGGLATSSLARRQWVRGGELQHHILDPSTGETARSGLWSVTVAAPRCVQADVAAKTAFILGPRDGTAFLEDRGYASLLVLEDGSTRRVQGWPA